MSDDISSSVEAAEAFKDTVNDLMKGLEPIVAKHDKSVSDIGSSLKKVLTSDFTIAHIIKGGLSPTQKFMFARAWAGAMDAQQVIEKFIESTKSQWSTIENGTVAEQEAAALNIVDGMNIPNDGAQFLRSLYNKKDLLTPKEKAAVIEYFKACIDYAQMYEDFKREERK